MRFRTLISTTLVAAALIAAPASAQTQFAGEWGKRGADPGTFGAIIDVATDARGYVYVLDEPDGTYQYEGRVQKFLPDGKLVRQWGLSSDDDVQPLERPDLIADPSALAVSPAGDVFVAEEGSQRVRISRWTTKGSYRGAFSSEGPGPGQISARVGGMTVAGDGRLLVADGGNKRVTIFTAAGQPAGEIQYRSPPDEDGYQSTFTPDGAIAAGGGGQLFMAANYGVLVGDGAGIVLGGFGGEGTDPGQFQSVAGVAISGDAVYAVDSRLSRVQRFTPGGAFVGLVGGTPGAGPGQFNLPSRVAVDCRGAAYVADTGNFRIQRFGPTGPPCSDFSKDPSESLTVTLAGPRTQDFREEFAVRPQISCDRPCEATLSGTVTIGGAAKKVRGRTKKSRQGRRKGRGRAGKPRGAARKRRSRAGKQRGDARKPRSRAGKSRPGARAAGAGTGARRVSLGMKAKKSRRRSRRAKGRSIKLVTERVTLNYPDPFTASIAPTESGTDRVVSVLRRDGRATATVKLTVRDRAGETRTLSRSYRLR